MLHEPGLFPRVAEQVGGVVEDHDFRPGMFRRGEYSADLVPHGELLLPGEEVTDCRRPEEEDRMGAHQGELLPEEGEAGLGFPGPVTFEILAVGDQQDGLERPAGRPLAVFLWLISGK